MTPIRSSTSPRLAVVVVLGIALAGCSGPDTEPSSAGTTPVIASPAPTSGPSDSTVDSTPDPTASNASSTAPGTGPDTTSTTAAPPPTGRGGTVPVATVAPQPPTPIGTPAADAGGLRFTIDSIAPVDGEASGPGEIGGPALQVTVRATNTSTAPVDMALTLVDLRHGTDDVPATPFALGTTPFAGTLAPGSSATGVYVFGVPVERRDQVRIYVSARPELPAVVFEGSAR